MSEKQEKNPLLVLGLALGLPSTILGVSLGILYLIKHNFISKNSGIFLIIAVVANTFFLMIKYTKRNEDK